MRFSIFKRQAVQTPNLDEEKVDVKNTVPGPELAYTQEDEDGLSASDVLANKLYRSGLALGFFDPLDEDITTGVTIRGVNRLVTSCPFQSADFREFEIAVEALNVRVALKIHCKTVEMIFAKYL